MELARNHCRPKIISNTSSNSFISQSFPLFISSCAEDASTMEDGGLWATGRLSSLRDRGVVLVSVVTCLRQLRGKQPQVRGDPGGLGVNPVWTKGHSHHHSKMSQDRSQLRKEIILRNKLTSLPGLSKGSCLPLNESIFHLEWSTHKLRCIHQSFSWCLISHK